MHLMGLPGWSVLARTVAVLALSTGTGAFASGAPPRELPGRLEAEQMDRVGRDAERLATIEATTDPYGGGGGVRWEQGTHAQLQHPIHLPPGEYELRLRIRGADQQTAVIHAELDGVALASVPVESAAGNRRYHTIASDRFDIPQDTQATLSLRLSGADVELNWIEIARTDIPFVRRDGMEVVVNGEPIRLRGWSLGSWLVLEGYALDIYDPGYQSHTEYLNAVEDLIGAEGQASFLKDWREQTLLEADIADLSAKGFNVVRVPFRYDLFYDDATGQLTDEGFFYFDRLLGWAKKHDVYVIFVLHAAPKPQSKSAHAGYPSTPDPTNMHGPLWDDGYEHNRDLAARIWRHIAQRYRNHSSIAGYDLLNEPVLEGDSHAWKLRDFYVTATNAIREVDPHHMVWGEGTWFGVWLQPLRPRWDDNMGYSIHCYWTDVPSPNIQEQVQIAQQQDVPLWLGETGENSTHWYSRFRKDIEARGVHWTWWAHKLHHTKGLYRINLNKNLAEINRYWRGERPRPNGAASANAFKQLVEDATFQNLTLNFPVLDSLTRMDFDQNPVPFNNHPHTVPGRIPLIDYDSGANGVAYRDTAYESTGANENYTNYNTAWGYRNEGVDIAYDNHEKGYVVIEFMPTEWLNYTTNITKGQYTPGLRVSSRGGARINLALDGHVIATFQVPDTAGRWVDVRAAPASLPINPAGQLRLNVLSGQAKVNYLDLD